MTYSVFATIISKFYVFLIGGWLLFILPKEKDAVKMTNSVQMNRAIAMKWIVNLEQL